jgi:hypothetical protein
MAKRLAAIGLMLLCACTTSFDLVPVSAAEAQRAKAELSTRSHTRFTDTRGGVHEIDGPDGVTFEELQSPSGAVASGRWQAQIAKSVPDGGKIVSWLVATALVGGLVAGNVACFGTNVCADGTTIVVGVVDGAILLTGITLVVVLAGAWSHFRGD